MSEDFLKLTGETPTSMADLVKLPCRGIHAAVRPTAAARSDKLWKTDS